MADRKRFFKMRRESAQIQVPSGAPRVEEALHVEEVTAVPTETEAGLGAGAGARTGTGTVPGVAPEVAPEVAPDPTFAPPTEAAVVVPSDLSPAAVFASSPAPAAVSAAAPATAAPTSAVSAPTATPTAVPASAPPTISAAPSDGVAYVPWRQMHDFMMDAFQAYGVPHNDAEICTDVLMESDRRGIASHGVNRFKPIYLDRIKNGTLLPTTNLEVLRETPTTLVFDAHDGMGMVASYQMMVRLVEKAKVYGMAGGAIRNSTHYGIAGYWATMATRHGFIGITGTNARPSVAPTFGVENMLGTNPLTIGLPTDEPFPFVIDCATSITQRGKIERYAREGLDTPAGMVVGRDGRAMTDSAAILEALVAGEAALAPLGGIGEDLGGYKGYGYSTVVEILSAALAGGNFMKSLTGVDGEGNPQMYGLGHFFFVVNPEAFVGIETFRKIAGDICRELRASQVAPGAAHIYTAGEKEYLAWLKYKDTGVPVSPALQKELVGIRNELGLAYTFAFESLAQPQSIAQPMPEMHSQPELQQQSVMHSQPELQPQSVMHSQPEPQQQLQPAVITQPLSAAKPTSSTRAIPLPQASSLLPPEAFVQDLVEVERVSFAQEMRPHATKTSKTAKTTKKAKKNKSQKSGKKHQKATGQGKEKGKATHKENYKHKGDGKTSKTESKQHGKSKNKHKGKHKSKEHK